MTQAETYKYIYQLFISAYPNVDFNQVNIKSCNYTSSEALVSQVVTIVFETAPGSNIYDPGTSTCTFGIPIPLNSYRYRTKEGQINQVTTSDTNLDLSDDEIVDL
jgi:hypothetical protein